MAVPFYIHIYCYVSSAGGSSGAGSDAAAGAALGSPAWLCMVRRICSRYTLICFMLVLYLLLYIIYKYRLCGNVYASVSRDYFMALRQS